MSTSLPHTRNGSHPSSRDTSYLDKYPGARVKGPTASSVKIRQPSFHVAEPWSVQIEDGSNRAKKETSQVSRKPVGSGTRPGLGERQSSMQKVADTEQTVSTPSHSSHVSASASNPTSMPKVFATDYNDPSIPIGGSTDLNGEEQQEEVYEQLQYHHTFEREPKPKPLPPASHAPVNSYTTGSVAGSSEKGSRDSSQKYYTMSSSDRVLSRPGSAMALSSDLHRRGRSLTPQDHRSDHSGSPASHSRALSASPHPDSKRLSHMDLLHIPYAQQMAHQNLAMDNAQLRGSVGMNASLLDTRKTLEMYRANVKKTNDSDIQYEFAVFMVNAANEMPAANVQLREGHHAAESNDRAQLLGEARQILQKLADRGYVYAQYYLGDAFSSGLFNKGREDPDRAFPLFVSAGKHGHAEAAYRAGLCYEFGWGCRKDYPKAVQFYRQAATKNHPGASTRLGTACLDGDLGLAGRYKEGIKWLKRGTESADSQHNSAPFELGMLHIQGYGDEVFKDESYAAQLFTKAAELGHPEANLRMGEAYEHGLLNCPTDPALSIHFYTGAAQAGVPKAMMALCAWYMIGAQPVLEKDEVEACAWAKEAAQHGYAKAEYAVGYFTEMGMGCRRDPLEANVWYVRAADNGDERAKQRLAIIRAAETGDSQLPTQTTKSKMLKKKKSMAVPNEVGLDDKKDDKDCIVM